jgi:putative ABC transport system permease protein
MFKHFLAITFRALKKNKVFSFLNIFGLAIGLACAGLIFLWVEDELSWDSNHLNKDRIYLVRVNVEQDAGTWTHSSTPGPLARTLEALPVVEATCRTSESSDNAPVFRIGNRAVEAAGIYAEPSVFGVFTIPFVQGNPQTAFTQLSSLVITQSAARKFFGEEKKVVGRTVRMDDKQDYVVTGVVKDMPVNSTLQFEWLAPFQLYLQASGDHWQGWNNFGLTTYVEMKPGANVAAINRRLLQPKYDFTTQKAEADRSSSHIFLFGMKDWRLYDQFENGVATGSGRIQYVRLFSTIAWIVLLIACINFMNLATARSEKRSKEVGVRKVLGARRGALVSQFLGEALFMSLLAAICAVVIVLLALPAFNLLVGKSLSAGLDQPLHIGALVALTLVCGIVAGSYPSLYLSSFNPVFVLKGIKLRGGGTGVIRRGLVILQFTASIVLVIATIIIYQQTKHVKSRDLGFNKDNLVELPLRGGMGQHFAAIRQDLINTGAVENAALADHTTLNAGNNTGGITWVGKRPDSKVTVSQRLVSPQYVSTLGMHIREGRDFVATDTINLANLIAGKGPAPLIRVVITSSLERLMGSGSAVGKQLTFNSNFGPMPMTVVGVIRDYVYGDMYGTADPVVFYPIQDYTSLMYVRLKPGVGTQQAIARMETVIRKDNPGYPFEFSFVGDQFNQLFLSEMLISRLSRVFASLAILISCLGLFGLAAFMAERRIKEIGIRKVLGASTGRITQLLSRDFLRLVLVSCLIAFPLAGWMMHNWLQGYAYRIGIEWWVFAAAGLIAVAIALVTVGSQALRAAVSNPTKALRSE